MKGFGKAPPKRRVGHPLQAYVARRRTEHAKLLMVSTGEPLGQIALASGFADQAQFSRVFRRESGSYPLQCRRAQGVSTETPARPVCDGSACT